MIGRAAAMRGLFRRHAELRAVIDAVLEGRLGTATALGTPPRVARLSLGCYEVFGGDPTLEEARGLIESVAAPRELVYGNDGAWRRLILERLGRRVVDRPMRVFDPSRLDPAALASTAGGIPDGFELRRLDAALAERIDVELEPHALQVFPDAADFAARGIGYGAVADGRLACAATSYAISSRSVEVAVATRPCFRGRGLAAVVAAAMLRHCLDAGLAPHWSAANPISQLLALRLGYLPAGTCEVLYLGRP